MTMKIHFREQYGRRGEEVLYVTPAGKETFRTLLIDQE